MKNMPQALECFEIPFSNMLQAYNKEKDKINKIGRASCRERV